jgi:hypothetical protein
MVLVSVSPLALVTVTVVPAMMTLAGPQATHSPLPVFR